MKAYQPYSWYRCSNQRCAMLTALPEGMIGRQLALLSSQTIEIESVILVCSHCNCVCNCTPIGRRAPIPVQVLSKSPRMSYVGVGSAADTQNANLLRDCWYGPSAKLHGRLGAVRIDTRAWWA